jgi:hypothetical protein
MMGRAVLKTAPIFSPSSMEAMVATMVAMMLVMVREVIGRVIVLMLPSGAWDQPMHKHE